MPGGSDLQGVDVESLKSVFHQPDEHQRLLGLKLLVFQGPSWHLAGADAPSDGLDPTHEGLHQAAAVNHRVVVGLRWGCIYNEKEWSRRDIHAKSSVCPQALCSVGRTRLATEHGNLGCEVAWTISHA